MSKINFTYFRNIEDIKMTTKDINNSYCDLCFNVADRNTFEDYKITSDVNKKISINNLEVLITEDNNRINQIKYPPDNVTFKSTDQFFLFSERIYWKLEDEFSFTVKVGKFEKKFKYKVPKPEQPYKSWIWKDNQWNAPVAYPDADKDYIWNEEKLNWELN